MVNYSDIAAINGTWYGAIRFINNVSGHSFIALILIALWFIFMFIMTMRTGFLEALTSVSFVLFIISLIFQAIGAATFMLLISFFALTVIGGILLILKGRI